MNKKSQELSDLFLAGDEKQALDLVQTYLENHTKNELYQLVLTPAMYRIGELWEKNIITVADEHLATAICDFVVSVTDVRRPVKNISEKKVMVLGPEGEDHYIGLKMVASLFKENGWEVQYLGPNLPLDAAIDSANRWKPDVIALSAALAYRLPVLKKYAQSFIELDFKPSVILGGRAVAMANWSASESEGMIIVKELDQLKEWIHTGKEPDNDFSISFG
ncbi:cobalamin-binding domain protein [Planococcus sp. CPCC 101016]|uniref:cobalamin B12-binding domain-containing protein n=1 Tax=Planococcus sp. CPCC 101016 TaxID=2599617 RepID=UPI0011B80B4A|nr:B12-binding domain-containing protein [Planococcus sp. CPCC 101016]TWT07207.1 cobalamin-binding domain protein [Planococcus sp. CPCC 101016]